jgi:high-affinity K+ transport system ATPase subunit B
MAKNPVMFIVEVGACSPRCCSPGPRQLVGVGERVRRGWWPGWLWFTVLFANFAEAMAEGRGKAQADTLRKTRRDRGPRAQRRRQHRGGGLEPNSRSATRCVVEPAR